MLLPLTCQLLCLYKVLLHGIHDTFIIGSMELLIVCLFLKRQIFRLELLMLIACTFELSELIFVSL